MRVFFATCLVAVVVVLVGADLTEEQTQKLKTYHKECAEQTGVDLAVVQKARQGSFSGDQKLKDHILCVAKKIGFINDAGDIQKDLLVTKLSGAINDEAIAKRLVDECALKKDTPAETAYDTFICYYEKTPTHIAIV